VGPFGCNGITVIPLWGFDEVSGESVPGVFPVVAVLGYFQQPEGT
jgi:hypothetical protein